MDESKVYKAYKKRIKAQQNRIEIEHNVNIRLANLLAQCEPMLNDGLLKDSVKHELKMLKYKYFTR